MRKGSTKKPVEPIDPEHERFIPDFVPARFVATEVIPDSKVLDILLRICDACYGIQQQLEPWASIRKDIDKLK